MPGVIHFKIKPNDSEQAFKLWNQQAEFAEGPDEIVPPGLPLERQNYLPYKIREFVTEIREDVCDLVCPNPVGADDVQSAIPSTSACKAGKREKSACRKCGRR